VVAGDVWSITLAKRTSLLVRHRGSRKWE